MLGLRNNIGKQEYECISRESNEKQYVYKHTYVHTTLPPKYNIYRIAHMILIHTLQTPGIDPILSLLIYRQFVSFVFLFLIPTLEETFKQTAILF